MASELMSNEIALLAIFILSVFVGFEVVSKVSTTLHTPLMSGANAIHGVISGSYTHLTLPTNKKV